VPTSERSNFESPLVQGLSGCTEACLPHNPAGQFPCLAGLLELAFVQRLLWWTDPDGATEKSLFRQRHAVSAVVCKVATITTNLTRRTKQDHTQGAIGRLSIQFMAHSISSLILAVYLIPAL
jgi:hypothetical protein